jgi:hypothetical protein
MQTQDTQFDSGSFDNTETYGGNAVRLSTSPPTEALIAYGEGTVQTPRYRLWTGTSWGAEQSAQSVGGTIQWVKTEAAPTRDEYLLATQDSLNDVNVQVYNGASDTWGNLVEVTAGVSSNTRRGFDITYESSSGDGMIVYCDGDADPSYQVWDGTGWTAGTINVASANNCEYIALASNPVSDEIIMVSRDTGAAYEAQVWNGSSWSQPAVLGSMNQAQHEGISVEYEESGDQAVVVVSNGTNPSFLWTSWDGTEWTLLTTTFTTGNDFEWGVLSRDQGSDNMILCYIDENNDIGVVQWDGSGWLGTYLELDTAGNTSPTTSIPDGRPVSCEFETTTGRDGYIMVPYSDTCAARSRYWNGSSWSTPETTISTIQDSWTVSTVRTGDGKILAAAHDDSNGRYDFSYWDGVAWSTASTLENTTSVTAEPYREPIAMAAQTYQSRVGTTTSDVVDFSLVTQNTWGEARWNTTEPTGTDVKVQVMYASGGVCSSLVPDIALPGNSSGYDVSAAPLDLSGLSTTTYNGLCLRAVLSSSNASSPTLDDWTITWERQPFLTQTNYKWYVNTNAATPTDIWPSGATDINENEAIAQAYAPSSGAVMRLRMNILAENVALSTGALTLTLQYAEGATCSESMTWLPVGGIGSTTAAWRGYNNAAVSDGATLSSVLLSTADTVATYEEENDSSTNPNAVSANNEGEWDWVLEHNATAGTSYCFRVITAQGETLDEYDRYPALVTNRKPNTPALEAPFDNEQLASTTPWFEFSAEDAEGNDVTYQVQIDNDTTFASPVIDRDSQTNFTEFSNVITPADKDPFTSGQIVRFVPTTALTNGTTYYWRVRGKDRNASATWSDWSSTYSVTINTGTTITTWYQTTAEQFTTNTFDDTEVSGNDVILTTGFTPGTTTGAAIDFDDRTTGNAWGSLSWNDNETTGDIRYRIEYLNGSTWTMVPDADLSGNSSGFGTSPVSLLSLSPTTYNQIRVVATLTNIGGTPRLLDWTVAWGLAVEQPTQYTLFDNEKTGTTTPTFTFESSDPQNDDLVYEVSISTSPSFTASTTRTSLSASPPPPTKS